MNILVVDDEKLIVKGLAFSLEQDGNTVDCAFDGSEAFQKIKENDYDIVLLDLMLPEMNGYEVCEKVRTFSRVPIIMLTAKSEDDDKIMGLECGADDYITKPFNVMELKARIKAVMRRVSYSLQKEASDSLDPNNIVIGSIKLDVNNRRCYIAGREYNLTSKEFDILALLCSNPNMIFSREKLLNIVWGSEYPGDVRTVDVHVRRLREKIEPNPGEPSYVHTKWGVGYFYGE
ncbi:MAG: response regulator transcription factor [Lachnospiraceae bacterium]|nr:response regulator transcription factor [Lachnospiraceae bacterium]